MGIVNVTPDSFSDGGRYLDTDTAVRHGLALAADGADLLDVGGESTRPGAEDVTEDEELRRVIPVIESLAGQAPVPVSVDTRKARVAAAALEAGAAMVNDVSALRHDPDMVGAISRHGATVVLMHMRGEPATMQQNPGYNNVVAEVYTFFEERIAACRAAGIQDIWIDPGIGFGKRLEDNLALLRHLRTFTPLGCPIMVGTSRKRFLGAITGRETADRLAGTIASCLMARQHGAAVLRVHDVREIRDALLVADAIAGENN